MMRRFFGLVLFWGICFGVEESGIWSSSSADSRLSFSLSAPPLLGKIYTDSFQSVAKSDRTSGLVLDDSSRMYVLSNSGQLFCFSIRGALLMWANGKHNFTSVVTLPSSNLIGTSLSSQHANNFLVGLSGANGRVTWKKKTLGGVTLNIVGNIISNEKGHFFAVHAPLDMSSAILLRCSGSGTIKQQAVLPFSLQDLPGLSIFLSFDEEYLYIQYNPATDPTNTNLLAFFASNLSAVSGFGENGLLTLQAARAVALPSSLEIFVTIFFFADSDLSSLAWTVSIVDGVSGKTKNTIDPPKGVGALRTIDSSLSLIKNPSSSSSSGDYYAYFQTIDEIVSYNSSDGSWSSSSSLSCENGKNLIEEEEEGDGGLWGRERVGEREEREEREEEEEEEEEGSCNIAGAVSGDGKGIAVYLEKNGTVLLFDGLDLSASPRCHVSTQKEVKGPMMLVIDKTGILYHSHEEKVDIMSPKKNLQAPLEWDMNLPTMIIVGIFILINLIAFVVLLVADYEGMKYSVARVILEYNHIWRLCYGLWYGEIIKGKACIRVEVRGRADVLLSFIFAMAWLLGTSLLVEWQIVRRVCTADYIDDHFRDYHIQCGGSILASLVAAVLSFPLIAITNLCIGAPLVCCPCCESSKFLVTKSIIGHISLLFLLVAEGVFLYLEYQNNALFFNVLSIWIVSFVISVFLTPVLDFSIFCGYCDAKDRAWKARVTGHEEKKVERKYQKVGEDDEESGAAEINTEEKERIETQEGYGTLNWPSPSAPTDSDSSYPNLPPQSPLDTLGGNVDDDDEDPIGGNAYANLVVGDTTQKDSDWAPSRLGDDDDGGANPFGGGSDSGGRGGDAQKGGLFGALAQAKNRMMEAEWHTSSPGGTSSPSGTGEGNPFATGSDGGVSGSGNGGGNPFGNPFDDYDTPPSTSGEGNPFASGSGSTPTGNPFD